MPENERRVAVFLSQLGLRERSECLSRLRRIPAVQVPFVHFRSDMHPCEWYDWMSLGAYRGNLHNLTEYPVWRWPNFRPKLFVENSGKLLEAQDVVPGIFEGICLDLAHLESDRQLSPVRFQALDKLIGQMLVGANHISAVLHRSTVAGCQRTLDDHRMVDTGGFSEFEYLHRYIGSGQEYLGAVLALELTNPLPEQRALKDHLERVPLSST